MLKPYSLEPKLKDFLLDKKSAILEKWFDVILESYPADTSSFLKSQKNQFANPVGHTLMRGIEGLFEELLQGRDSEKVPLLLDNIIRIRAVQDFSPSQSINFIFLLKRVLREKLKMEQDNSGQEKEIFEELLKLESRIDDLALLSFDIFMKCREKIYELKTNEIRNMTFRLLQKANLVYEIKEEELVVKDSNINNLYEARKE